MIECSAGDAGVPLSEVVEEDFILAEEAGTGSQACAGVGLAGSSGGAFKLLFGMEEIG
jgi:hypothetical protein